MIHTKIIATVGPASISERVLGELIDAGVNVFRLNFSHGTLEQHEAALQAIRSAAAARQALVAIMGDLGGPKIRLGTISGGPRAIAVGGEVRIVREARRPDALDTNYPPFVDEIGAGQRILIDDGQVRLRVIEKRPDELRCVCEAGGVISDHKGINLPDTALSLPALTPKDEIDLAWALRQRLDFVALSFVRRAEDLIDLRRRIRAAGGATCTVAKIEKPEAIEHLDDIIEACDVMLVARGDLGVEMDVARVPLLQKDMIRQCRYAGRPVIVATQMLQSMVEQPVPTRAEVSDVANAILDAADAVMLSAETAVGKHPIEAVRMIRRIAEQTEPLMHRLAPRVNTEVLAATMRVTSAVARGAALLARDLSAKVVAVWTHVGNTPRLLSKHRLEAPVVGLCGDEAICRRLAMYYGVIPLHLSHDPDERATLARLDAALIERGLAAQGELSIIIAGTQLMQPGSTNTLLIHLVGQGDAVGREAT